MKIRCCKWKIAVIKLLLELNLALQQGKMSLHRVIEAKSSARTHESSVVSRPCPDNILMVGPSSMKPPLCIGEHLYHLQQTNRHLT